MSLDVKKLVQSRSAKRGDLRRPAAGEACAGITAKVVVSAESAAP